MEFKDELENLFDIAHKNASEDLLYDEDKKFLSAQREKGLRGFLSFPIDTSQLTNDETSEEEMGSKFSYISYVLAIYYKILIKNSHL